MLIIFGVGDLSGVFHFASKQHINTVIYWQEKILFIKESTAKLFKIRLKEDVNKYVVVIKNKEIIFDVNIRN